MWELLNELKNERNKVWNMVRKYGAKGDTDKVQYYKGVYKGLTTSIKTIEKSVGTSDEIADNVMDYLAYAFDGYYMSDGGYARHKKGVKQIIEGAKLDDDGEIIEEEIKDVKKI